VTILQAIEEMARIYKPGAIEWWAAQPNDRWQANNDQWEQCTFDKDPAFVEASNILWLQKQKELLEIYEMVNPQPKVLSPLDAFMLEGSGRTKDLVSKIEKVCYQCESPTDVETVRSGDTFRLFCPKCIQPKKGESKT